MIADADIAAPASLMGDATRATFLMALSRGQSLPAGELARRARVTPSTASVQLAKLVAGGLLTVELEPTRRGAKRVGELGIDVDQLAGRRRPFTKRCLDWTERRHHLAGSLGAALAILCFDLGWIERLPTSRAVRVTEKGRRGL